MPLNARLMGNGNLKTFQFKTGKVKVYVAKSHPPCEGMQNVFIKMCGTYYIDKEYYNFNVIISVNEEV